MHTGRIISFNDTRGHPGLETIRLKEFFESGGVFMQMSLPKHPPYIGGSDIYFDLKAGSERGLGRRARFKIFN